MTMVSFSTLAIYSKSETESETVLKDELKKLKDELKEELEELKERRELHEELKKLHEELKSANATPSMWFKQLKSFVWVMFCRVKVVCWIKQHFFCKSSLVVHSVSMLR